MIYTHVAAALLAGLLAFAGAWQTQEWRYEAREAQRLEALAETKRMNELAADAGAAGHESDKAAIKTEFITITKEVRRVVEKPIYRNVCLDADGLRILERAISGQPAASQPAPTLPKDPVSGQWPGGNDSSLGGGSRRSLSRMLQSTPEAGRSLAQVTIHQRPL